MKLIRTGDLYLGNRWSIQSLLSKTANPESMWSEAGIFVVDDSDPEESEVYVYFVDQQVEKVLLADILSEVNLQSAAHRRLLDANVRQISDIAGFLRGTVGMNSLSVERSLSSAIPVNDGSQITSSGQRINEKGRSLTYSSKSKRGYHSVDLVVSALASAGLMNYNPDLTMHDLQDNSTLDTIYGPENPLMPAGILDRDLIVKLAENEVSSLMDYYIAQVPQTNVHTVRTSRDAKRPYGRSFLAKSANPGSEIPTVEPNYLEQHSVTEIQGANRGAANKKAEDLLSQGLDRRLRKQNADLSKHPKPQPKFQKFTGSPN